MKKKEKPKLTYTYHRLGERYITQCVIPPEQEFIVIDTANDGRLIPENDITSITRFGTLIIIKGMTWDNAVRLADRMNDNLI